MDYRDLLSGQRRDPLAVCLRGLLRVAETPYRLTVAHRNRGFDTGKRDIHRCGVPVVSIGNLTTGGTGKTPLVCYVAKQFRKSGIRVAIVSRGYGAEAGEDNDEALELARALPDVPHVQDADRVAAARIAVEELDSELLLMDDGFQHRRLHRELDIVVIDATNPFGYEHLLPRGLLREPIASLSRADIVVLSRSDRIDAEQRLKIQQLVRQHSPTSGWAEAVHAPSSLLTWPEQLQDLESLRGKRVALLSAIGNPAAFAATMKDCGAEIVDVKMLPDHDRFSRETVASIVNWLEQLSDNTIEVVCTHKDLVKLQTDRLAGYRVSALLIELQFTVGESELLARLNLVAATMNFGAA